jgi:L,D-transpeptidase YbiS
VSKDIQLDINISGQSLSVIQDGTAVKVYKVSTAKNGPGEISNSECTPRGRHIIRAKIGGQADINTVFVGRRDSGERYSYDLKQQYPERDWILTRILWLSGCEPGVNRLGNVDTMRRYIYIHGCPDEDEMGVASSHGCIKMRNDDVIELFEMVSPGTPVNIKE